MYVIYSFGCPYVLVGSIIQLLYYKAEINIEQQINLYVTFNQFIVKLCNIVHAKVRIIEYNNSAYMIRNVKQ